MILPFRLPLRTLFYTFKEIILPFLGGMIFFTFVFLMFQAVRLADYFINHGVGIALLAKLTIYVSSAFLPVVLPISFLVAVLIGFGRLSADSEIVAFKASGVSIYKLFLPVGVSSLFVSAAVFYLAFFYIPWANYQFKRTVVKLGNTKAVSHLREGTFTEGFFDLLVYADRVDVEQNRLDGVFIYDERNPKSPSVVIAKSGTVIPQKTNSEFSASAILNLQNGAIHRTDPAKAAYEKVGFEEYNLLLSVSEGESGEISYPKTRTQTQLWGDMNRYQSEKNFSLFIEYATEYWRRIGLGIAPLIFGILGVGLGTVRIRNVKSNAIFVCVAIIFIYWVLSLGGSTLAEKGWISPFVAMQMGNFLTLPLAVFTFRRASW